MIVLPPSVKAVTATFHPSYAWKRRTPQLIPQIVNVLRYSRQIPARGIGRPALTVRFLKRAHELRAFLAETAPLPLCVDIETPRDNHKKITIVSLSARPGEAVVFEYDDDFGDVISELMADAGRLKYGHNFIPFDVKSFRANGMKPAMPIGDTIIAEALLCPPFKEAKKMRWLALSTAVARRVRGWAYHKEPDRATTKALYRVWFPTVPEGLYPLLYCALDTISNLLLWHAQKPELVRKGMMPLYKDVCCPAAFTLSEMEERGIPIDDAKRLAAIEHANRTVAVLGQKVIEYTTTMHADRRAKLVAKIDSLCAERKAIGNAKSAKSKAITPRVAKLRTKLKQIGEEFNPTNDNHWRWLLFADAGLGLTPTRVTATGIPGVKKDDIEQLRELYPEVEVLAWRVDIKTEARRRQLFESLVPDENGRAHFVFSITRAENGRFSSGNDDSDDEKFRESEGGNAQNLTERDREIFVAPPGHWWIDFDLKQVELRDMAWVAEEWDLVRYLIDGADIHSENAATIFGCKAEDARKTKVWFAGRMDTARQGGKRVAHLWDYGGGDKKVGDLARPFHKRPMEEVTEFLAQRATETRGAEGMTLESFLRRTAACAKSDDPEGEERKMRLKLYEMANTLKARGWRLRYFDRWQRFASFQKETVYKVEQDRELQNTFGRVLRFWNFKWDFDNKRWILLDREEALAFVPASDVGDMVKVLLPMIDACAKRHGAQLVTTTHDSFSTIMPEGEARVRAFIAEAKGIMERKWPQYRPHPEFGQFWVPCDVSIGRNWGKKTESNPDGLEEWKEEVRGVTGATPAVQ